MSLSISDLTGQKLIYSLIKRFFKAPFIRMYWTSRVLFLIAFIMLVSVKIELVYANKQKKSIGPKLVS